MERTGGLMEDVGIVEEVEGADAPASKGASGKRQVVIVANRTGGQGKTLIAQLLSSRFSPRGAKFYSADSSAGGDGSSKFFRILGTLGKPVEDYGIGFSADQARRNVRDDVAFWDGFGKDVMGDDDRVFLMDLGANVVDGLLEWGDEVGGCSWSFGNRAIYVNNIERFELAVPGVDYNDESTADVYLLVTRDGRRLRFDGMPALPSGRP